MRKHLRPPLFLLMMMLFSPSANCYTAPKIALIVGNSAYLDSPLRNPVHDANLIEKTLTSLGFEVIKHLDVTQNAFKRAIRDFGDKLELAGKDSIGLFYYSGHGIQTNGINYLIPVNAEIRRESDVGIEAVPASDVLSVMDYARNRLNIVILDACRNNPFARSFRSASRGLARMSAPQGTLVAYATAPGKVARDGDGNNSPYTAALTRMMTKPNLVIEQMFKSVRRNVMAATHNRQIPWESSSLTDDFFFSTDNDGGNTTQADSAITESDNTPGHEVVTPVNSQKFIENAKKIADDIEKNANIYSREKIRNLTSKVVDNVQKAVSLDNAEAYYLLAMLHEDGYGNIDRDMQKMIDNIIKSAEKGFAPAQYMLGDMYADGDEVVKNRKKAIYWLDKAAKQGNKEAKQELERLLGNTQSTDIANKLSRPRIESGQIKPGATVQSCDRLAAHSLDSDAVAPGVTYENLDAEAIIIACTSAISEQPGIPRLKTQLGRGLHKAGRHDEALRILRDASRKGSALSMALIGIMYMKGDGVEKSLSDSLHWLEKAAERGNTGGMVFTASMYLRGEGAEPDPQRATMWYQKAVDAGVSQAMSSLSILYDEGRGVRRSPDDAAILMLRAYGEGDDNATRILFKNPAELSIATRKEIQRRLKEVMLYNGKIDGKFGPGTKQALRSWTKK